ncbi:MAG: MFS transporter, partial [Saccharospirillum sp.]
YWLPAPPPAKVHEERRWQGSQLGRVVRDRQLVPLNLGVFVLHLTMTMMFVGLPVALVQQGVMGDQLGWVYAPVMVLSFLGMVPMIAIAERRKAHRPLLALAGVFIILALAALGVSSMAWLSIGMVWLFFVGFNFVEASLPSLISRRAPEHARGTAMGVFSTGQFLGAAFGGLCGGWAYQSFGMAGIAMIGISVMLVWIVLLWVLDGGVHDRSGQPAAETVGREAVSDDPNMSLRS